MKHDVCSPWFVIFKFNTKAHINVNSNNWRCYRACNCKTLLYFFIISWNVFCVDVDTRPKETLQCAHFLQARSNKIQKYFLFIIFLVAMWSQVLFEFYLCVVTSYTIQVFKKVSKRDHNKELFVAKVSSEDLEFNTVADPGFPRFWSIPYYLTRF